MVGQVVSGVVLIMEIFMGDGRQLDRVAAAVQDVLHAVPSAPVPAGEGGLIRKAAAVLDRGPRVGHAELRNEQIVQIRAFAV